LEDLGIDGRIIKGKKAKFALEVEAWLYLFLT
jgi:hypothetical protein